MTALAFAIVCVEGEIHALMRDGHGEDHPAVVSMMSVRAHLRSLWMAP
jgi:hypothetical protein